MDDLPDTFTLLKTLVTILPGDSVKWSPSNGGCLMWVKDDKDWNSWGEGEFPNPATAERALLWIAEYGKSVIWWSLFSQDIPE